MAQHFKAHTVDDGRYPMPPDPRLEAQAQAQAQLHAANAQFAGAGMPGADGAGAAAAGPTIDPDAVQRVAGDLEAMMQTVAAMRPQVDSMSSALRESGQQQGYADGIARAQAEVQETLGQAMAALTDAQQQRHRIAQENDAALAELALLIARKVIGEHLQADPTLVGRIVEETIADLEPTTSLEVHVHPADLAAVEANRAALERLVSGPGQVLLMADDTVDQGGCVLTSPVGDVDARISTKLGVLETAFRAQRRQLAEDAGG
jgi:flagellar assembly protein FliH